jgi:ATP dependent DNA ligase-like protein
MPTRAGYAYEPKLDGFRCLIRTEGAFEVRSRRFWNMTPLLPELARFPVPGVFDGELIAFADGQPDFIALTDRMLLTKDPSIPVAFVAFDVLSLDGENVVRRPYRERRQLLESLKLAGPHWCTAPSFEDGHALWAVVERDELEGMVAKPLRSTYRPGDRRAWLKVKNRAYWKYELEREAAIERRVNRTARPMVAWIVSCGRFAQTPAEGQLGQRRNPVETGGNSRGSALTAQTQRTGDAARTPPVNARPPTTGGRSDTVGFGRSLDVVPRNPQRSTSPA